MTINMSFNFKFHVPTIENSIAMIEKDYCSEMG